MKQVQKKYSNEELEQIFDVFSRKGNTQERKALSEKLGRTVAALNSKHSWETKDSAKSKAKTKSNSEKDQIKLTLFNNKEDKEFVNPFLAKKETVVLVGDTKIIIPSSKFTINGITIEY